jgi:hypothetical protein
MQRPSWEGIFAHQRPCLLWQLALEGRDDRHDALCALSEINIVSKSTGDKRLGSGGRQRIYVGVGRLAEGCRLVGLDLRL